LDPALRLSEFVQERFDSEDVRDPDSASRFASISAVDEGFSESAPLECVLEEGEALEEIADHGFAALDFDGQEFIGDRIEDIDLMAGAVTKEAEVIPQPAVESIFQEFHEDHVLEQISAQGMMLEMSAALEAQEISGQADVVEIDFWGSNETLPNIGVIGLEEKDDKARLKQRQPFPGRRMRDARVASQAGIMLIASNSFNRQTSLDIH